MEAHDRRGELVERLDQAQRELEEVRSTVVGIDAQIEKGESELKTATAIADRDLEDLQNLHNDAERHDAFTDMQDLETKMSRRRTERTTRLNQIESQVGRLRGERIEAAGAQTARELLIGDLQGQLKVLDDSRSVTQSQLDRAEQLEERLAELEADRGQLAKRIDEYVPVVEAQREATTASGAEELAQAYADRAAEHTTEWRRWLKRLVALGVVAFVGGIAVILVTHPDADATNAELISAAAVNLLALGLLIYAVRFAAHQFSVHRHLEAVALGKAAALGTFNRIVAGPGEVEVRAAVSVALAQAVFDSGPTGFVDGVTDNVTLIERVLSPAVQRVSA